MKSSEVHVSLNEVYLSGVANPVSLVTTTLPSTLSPATKVRVGSSSWMLKDVILRKLTCACASETLTRSLTHSQRWI